MAATAMKPIPYPKSRCNMSPALEVIVAVELLLVDAALFTKVDAYDVVRVVVLPLDVVVSTLVTVLTV